VAVVVVDAIRNSENKAKLWRRTSKIDLEKIERKGREIRVELTQKDRRGRRE